ncbi:MAG TPA: OsmC family protein [Bacilli bacterium]|nr:OsmC family protein [Bacilli bacterium]
MTMNVRIDWKGKREFHAVGQSGHGVTMDAKAEAGGEDNGARPMEMLLMGLGGCTGIDIAMILEKGRMTVEEFRMELNAERAEEMPQRFTTIHMHYILKGPDLTPEKVERAIVLSKDKYCSASASLNAEFKTTFELNGEQYEVGVIGGQA